MSLSNSDKPKHLTKPGGVNKKKRGNRSQISIDMLSQSKDICTRKWLNKARTDAGTPHVMGKSTKTMSQVQEKMDVIQNNASSTKSYDFQYF